MEDIEAEQQQQIKGLGKRSVNRRGQVRPKNYRKKQKVVSDLVNSIMKEPDRDLNLDEPTREEITVADAAMGPPENAERKASDSKKAVQRDLRNEFSTGQPFPMSETSPSCSASDWFGQTRDSRSPGQNVQSPTAESDIEGRLSTSNETIDHLLAQVISNHTIDIEDYIIRDADVDFKTEQCNFGFADEKFEDTEPISANPQDDENATIYEGHNMPRYVSVLLILLYCTKYNVTGDQLCDILTLIGAHCLTVHPWLKSVYLFKQFFANVKSPLVKHHYCRSCLGSVSAQDEKCPNSLCEQNLQEFKAKLYFLEIPIESQLRSLYSHANFIKLILQRFSRVKTNDIEDIYDGEIYQNLSKTDGPLSETYPYNISFTWNTDGIPIFKSSNFSIWPMYLIINELPFKYRCSKEFSIFCGLWFGNMKPFMPTFSKPILSSLKKLETEGLSVNIGEKKININAYTICGTADLPAKSVAMNMTQFNGAFSCQRCLCKGHTERTDKGGNIHVYQYSDNAPRTSTSSLADAILATETGETIHGIKGPSFLMGLGSYDFVKSTSIDYMHCVLLGITKLLLKLWFSSSNRNAAYSLYQYIDIVDERLRKIKPPNQITRIPRSISSHLAYWKASELRSWLFFYSLPVLSDIMAPIYFLHFASLSESIFTLNKDSLSIKEIENCKIMLNYFVYMFPKLYETRYCTLNLHLLLHLTECVKQLGPLWAYSCFPFENMNGFLTKFFHGTQYIDLQIASSINMVQSIPSLLANVPEEFIAVAQRLVTHKLTVTETLKKTHLGKAYKKNLSKCIMQKVIRALEFCMPNTLIFYSRVVLRGCIIQSMDYQRVHVRNTYTVKFLSGKNNTTMIGYVCYFAKNCICSESVSNRKTCSCDGKTLAFISCLQQSSTNLIHSVDNYINVTAGHIHVLKRKTDNNVTDVIPVDKIVSVCVHVDLTEFEDLYVCEFPNFHELD